jgi:hypothetical protein
LKRLGLVSLVTPWVCAATFTVVSSCRRETASTVITPDVDAACGSLESTKNRAPDPSFPGPADPRTQLALIEDLERRVATAGDAELPALLLQLGRAKSLFQPTGRTPEPQFAKALSRDFEFNSIGDDWLYRGTDFEELIRRFPNHELADAAAYELTRLPFGGECEGYVPCYVSREWRSIATFLKAYPQSPLGDEAVTRALGAFGQIEPDQDLRITTDSYDPKAIGGLVTSLDAVGRVLPHPRRARLLLRAGELWESFADYDKAMSAYRAALDGAARPAHTCLEARLGALAKPWFTLDPVQVIHPRRIALRWRPERSDAKEFVIYRSAKRSEAGVMVAHVPPHEFTWTDTTTDPASAYWYRVVADTPGGLVQSNRAPTKTPGFDLVVAGIAVSVKDKRLHVFGRLSNGFPQVLHVSEDGSNVERSDAEFMGFDNGEARPSYAQYVDDVWLPNTNGYGALHFHGVAGALPGDVSPTVRLGRQFLLYYPEHPRWLHLLVSVDEIRNAAWMAQGGGGIGTPIAMDCLASGAACWFGNMRNVELRDENGRVLATAQPPKGAQDDSSWATEIFADPKDGSAWALLGRSARLLHIGINGIIREELTLDQWPVQRMTADFEHRAIWFARNGSSGHSPLVRIDLTDGAQTVLTENAPSFPRLAPDLTGGVWAVSQSRVSRIDRTGRVRFTVRLDSQ